MRDETVIDIAEADERHEAMDYAQHERTWEGVTTLVKWAIFHLAVVLVALYCFIFAELPWVGGLLLLIAILAPMVSSFLKAQR